MTKKPGQGFLGRPKQPGEERKRHCENCGTVTWQTYRLQRYTFQADSHMWRCNRCSRDSYFDV
jgi:hypothetical protein